MYGGSSTRLEWVVLVQCAQFLEAIYVAASGGENRPRILGGIEYGTVGEDGPWQMSCVSTDVISCIAFASAEMFGKYWGRSM